MPVNLSVRDFATRLQGGRPVYLVDVRTPEENAIARLPNSVLVPLSELAGDLETIQPPEGADLIVYCHHGVRSWHAAMFLEQAGFSPVYSLAGGIDAYSQAIDPNIPRY